MAEQRGGYRRPNNPAAVSGPGKFSQRTDGGPGETMKQAQRYISGMPYGEAGEINAIANAAPLAAGVSPEDITSQIIPLDAPSQRPSEPVTVPFSEVQAPSQEEDTVAAFIKAAYAQYPSPVLARLVQRLTQEGR